MDHTRPNIVLILADDMGYSDLGCMGSEIRTPHLDRVAANGVIFTGASSCARCCPSRASLLTGQYPHKAGIGHMGTDLGTPAYQGYLRRDCATIAELLRLGGYRTLMSGKWHVGGEYDQLRPDTWRPGGSGHPTPRQRGFDRFFGILDGACSYFFPHYLMEDDDRLAPGWNDFYLTDAISEKAVGMIEAATRDGQPFFCYLTYTAPHWPLHARPGDAGKYRAGYRRGGWDAVRAARHERMQGLGIIDRRWQLSPRDHRAPAWEEVPHHDWEAARMAVYAAQVEQMDRGIGTVLAALERGGVAGDTIVMFLSDNGACAEFMAEDGWARFYPTRNADGSRVQPGNRPDLQPGGADTFMSYDLPWANASNTPFRLFKHWVHEGGIATPLIVRWPARIAPGRLEHGPCHVVDIVPTLLEAAGVDYPQRFGGRELQPLDGESLAPAFTQPGWSRRAPIFWEHEGNCAVRWKRWKLVREHGRDWELYDMSVDRTELTDLSGKHRSMRNRLALDYHQWARQNGVIAWDRLSERLKRAWGMTGIERG